MLIHAVLIRRINRFVALVLINNTPEEIYVPNTGRMSELALPGAECLLAESHGKFRYKMRYIISKNFPVMIDSTLSNSLFAGLLQQREIPGLEEYSLVHREPACGRHRFDYLIRDSHGTYYMELKSCTLFHGPVASFPDAVSDRASSHIEALASTGCGKLVIFILNESAEVFIPNFHTDFNFYSTLKQFADQITISALKIKYNDKLEITSLTPVPVHIPEADKSGFYFMMLFSENDCYVYVSDVCADVFTAVKRFRDRSKSGSVLKGVQITHKVYDMPVLGMQPDYDMINRLFSSNGGKIFSDESTGGVFYRFSYNPAEKEWFWDCILGLRFSRFVPA